MEKIIEKNIKIENLIYEIRGKQVMLDSDLAKLYQVETKRINEAVKNNLNKFPERFSWILSSEEESNLRSKISTSSLKNNYGGRRYNTRVFTEQGVAMLATILKTNVASQISIKIMDAFVFMRHYIGNNNYRLSNIETKVIEHDLEIKLLQESFEKLEEKKKINDIYFNGQIFDAYSKIYEIFNKAKNNLIVIDSYADNTILDIVKRLNIDVIIITKKDNLLTLQDIEKYNKQYHNLKVIYNNTYHDRYFILDKNIIYHCCTSINRIGHKTFSITRINDKDICNLLINKIDNLINVIKENNIYKEYISILEKINSNEEIKELTNKIRIINKKLVRTPSIKLESELKDLESKLNDIPLYLDYKDKLNELNNLLLVVKNNIENYMKDILI